MTAARQSLDMTSGRDVIDVVQGEGRDCAKITRLAQDRNRLVQLNRLNMLVGWVFLVGGLIMNSASIVGALFSESEGEKTLRLAAVVLILLVWIIFGRYLLLRRNAQLRLDGMIRAAPMLELTIKHQITAVAKQIEVPLNQLRVFIQTKPARTAAFTLEVRDIKCLVLSPTIDAGTARAKQLCMGVVAHELAHFQQKDCDYLAIVFRYLAISAVLGVPGAILSGLATSSYIGVQTMAGLVGMIMLWLQFMGSRELRRTSERAADIFAVVSGYGKGILEALQQSVPPSRNASVWRRVFEYHPSRDDRIAWVRLAVASISPESDKASNIRLNGRLPGSDYGIRLAKRLGLLLLIVPVLLASIFIATIYIDAWWQGNSNR